MEAMGSNETNNCLDKMVRLPASDRMDVLLHAILMTIGYTPLKIGLFYDQRTEGTSEEDPEFWEKRHKWLNSLVHNFLKAAYSGDPKYLKETGWARIFF